MSCTDCHSGKDTTGGHSNRTIGRHVARVACQTCHIPIFAKNADNTIATEETEIHRDWQQPHPTASGVIHPKPTMAGNLYPTYKWWNGTSSSYLLYDRVASPIPTTIPTSAPNGSVNNDGSKLYPFKYKTAFQPLNSSTNELIALDTSVYFSTGNFVDATETNAAVTTADVKASNGVVHIINKVLLPQEVLDILNPPVPNIVETAQSVEDLSLLVAALIQADAGLVGVLSGDGPFTVFAPSNAAFAALLDALGNDYNSLADFDTDEEKALLARVLTYHVVAGAAVASTDLTNHQELMTVQGESLFAILGHGVQIRDKSAVDANVTTADVMASNGIVHIVDKVLQTQEIVDILNPSH